MRCANPDCRDASFDLPGGSLWLMELETSREELSQGEDDGFPICALTMKYFWLCIDCSQKYVLRRWTPSGLLLLPKPDRGPCKNAAHTGTISSKLPISIHASAHLESELLETV
jgi:hypothetical protein